MALTLAEPRADMLDAYAAALARGWSPNNVTDVSAEQLAALTADREAFVASLTAQGGTIRLPDGSEQPRLPYRVRWLWDGEFCGSISLRWQPGTDALPLTVLGHVGYAVVPWKRGFGYATQALGLICDEAREIGLSTVTLTCDPDNAASRRVIEKNGGRLTGRTVVPAYGPGERLFFDIRLRP